MNPALQKLKEKVQSRMYEITIYNRIGVRLNSKLEELNCVVQLIEETDKEISI